MKPWYYVVAALGIVAIVALVYTDNRDDESEVAGQASSSLQNTGAGALDTTLYMLSPNASIELLLDQSNLPEEAVPGLTEAQNLYVEALGKPADQAVPLLQEAEDQLAQTAETIGDMAIDASNQVTADNLRRLSNSILVIGERVQDDRERLEGTGTPIPAVARERIAA